MPGSSSNFTVYYTTFNWRPTWTRTASTKRREQTNKNHRCAIVTLTSTTLARTLLRWAYVVYRNVERHETSESVFQNIWWKSSQIVLLRSTGADRAYLADPSCYVSEATVINCTFDCCITYIEFHIRTWSLHYKKDKEFNQSINLFCLEYNKHWTGHQGRMQPPLTGAHKNNVSKSNKRQHPIREKIKISLA